MREVIALAAWVVALRRGVRVTPMRWRRWLPALGDAPAARYVVAFALILIVVLLVGALVGWLLVAAGPRGRAWASSTASWARVFGVARGVLIVVIVVLVAGLTTLPQQRLVAECAACAAAGRRPRCRLQPWLPPAWAERLDYSAAGRRPDAGRSGRRTERSSLNMCGIVGVVAHTPVNQLLYDGLLLLQHRGQDAAGIVTSEGPMFHMYKGPGYVRDVFRTRNMRDLHGQRRASAIAAIRRPARRPPSSSRSRSTSTRRSASRSRTTAT